MKFESKLADASQNGTKWSVKFSLADSLQYELVSKNLERFSHWLWGTLFGLIVVTDHLRTHIVSCVWSWLKEYP